MQKTDVDEKELAIAREQQTIAYDKMFDTIGMAVEKAVAEMYEDIKQQGKIIKGIDKVCENIRFSYPKLAEYVRKRMYEIADEKGDLP